MARFCGVETGIAMKPIETPQREGRDFIVELYLQYSVVGRLSMPRGDYPPTNMNLKASLEAAWGINNFKVISLKGAYQFLLNPHQDQSLVM